jgi:hypothetical protein
MLGRMLRTRAATTAALVLVLVALIVGATLLYLRLSEQRRHEMLRQAAGQIQLAVERYAVEHEGSYPRNIEELLEKDYLSDWPTNPYGKGNMRPLGVSEPWEPGGFVYVGWGPIVAMSKGFDPAEKPILPTEVDQYMLLFYSPHETGKKWPQRTGSVAKKPEDPVYISEMAPTVDWEHVRIALTAGEGLLGDK